MPKSGNDKVFTSPPKSIFSHRQVLKNRAFTLAETLITLMIIGIIAVLTIPAIVQKIQDNIFNARAKNVFYKLSQATDQMKALGLLETKYESTTAFIDEFSKHIKISQRCATNEISKCFGKTSFTNGWGQIINVDDLKTSSGLGRGKWNASTEAIILADGTPVLLTYNVTKCTPMPEGEQTIHSENQISNTLNCLSIVFNINDKSPNKVGKDIRVLNNSLDAYKIANTNFSISTPMPISKTYTYDECMAIGKTKCCTNYNYCNNADRWLHAYLTCDENEGHLPNKTEEVQIARDLYGEDVVVPPSYEWNYDVSVKNEELWNLLGGDKTYWNSSTNESTSSGFRFYRNSFYYNNGWAKSGGVANFFCIYN